MWLKTLYFCMDWTYALGFILQLNVFFNNIKLSNRIMSEKEENPIVNKSSNRLIYIVIGIALFLYLSDTFKQPSFQSSVKTFFNATMGNTTSHSILHWFANKTNSLAGLISVSSMTILNTYPVIKHLYFLKIWFIYFWK